MDTARSATATDAPTVVAVDPGDDAALDAWFAALDAVQQETWPGQPGWQRDELVTLMRDENPSERRVALAARIGDTTIGAGTVFLPLTDNVHRLRVYIDVHPAHRRRGAGRALLAAAERLAVEHGRTTIATSVEEPPARIGTSVGRAFALAHGFSLVQDEVRRVLALPPDEARLAALETAAAPYAAGYTFRTWRDRCPDDLVADRAVLAQRMSTDAPTGASDLGEEQWDVARVRHAEDLTLAQGRMCLGIGALAPDGRMIAFSTLGIPLSVPERAYQWDTLVLTEHRGHRLGTLLKIANLRELAAASPATREVVTWNAAENAPMIAVNEALGCTILGQDSVWERVAPGAGPVPA